VPALASGDATASAYAVTEAVDFLLEPECGNDTDDGPALAAVPGPGARVVGLAELGCAGRTIKVPRVE